MKIQEAIKLVKILKETLFEAYLIGKTYVGGTEGFEKNIDEIISLLQQGEKYKQMWGEIKDKIKILASYNSKPNIYSDILGLFKMYEREYIKECEPK